MNVQRKTRSRSEKDFLSMGMTFVLFFKDTRAKGNALKNDANADLLIVPVFPGWSR